MSSWKIEQLNLEKDLEPALTFAEMLLLELEDTRSTAPFNRKKVSTDLEKNRDKFSVFVARDEQGSGVGLLTLVESFAIYANGSYGVINELYIAPRYRSKGVGKALLDSVKEFGSKKGWKRIDVTAPEGKKWKRTVEFYLREGFEHTGPKLKFLL